MRVASKNSALRFLKNISIDRETGCWNWLASKNKGGYGNFTAGNIIGAHRYSYWLFNGDLIEGLVVDHKCRVKSCVNPEHLRQVTYSINSIENSSSTAHYHSLKTHCPKGHEYTEKNLLQITHKTFSRVCKECNRIRSKDNYAQNKDKINEGRRNKRKFSRDSGEVE